MSEIESISQAFSFLHQYEEYKLKKAWGMMMIVIGTLVFIGGFLSQYKSSLPGDPFAFARIFAFIGVVNQLIYLTVFSPFFISMLLAIYLFFTVKKTKISDNDEIIVKKYIYFGLALFLVSFLPIITLTFFRAVYPLSLVGDIINTLVLMIIYLLLKQIPSSNHFRELIPLGTILLIFTFPGEFSILLETWINQRWIFWEAFSSLGVTPDFMRIFWDLSHLTNFLVLSIGCIISGYYSIHNGIKILENQGQFLG